MIHDTYIFIKTLSFFMYIFFSTQIDLQIKHTKSRRSSNIAAFKHFYK